MVHVCLCALTESLLVWTNMYDVGKSPITSATPGVCKHQPMSATQLPRVTEPSGIHLCWFRDDNSLIEAFGKSDPP